MQTKLIKTKDYLILIDEEVEIIHPSYYYYKHFGEDVISHTDDVMKGLNTVENLNKDNFFSKIIAYRKLNENAKELDLPLLPNPFNPLNRRKFIYLVKNTKGGEKGNIIFEVIRFECLKEAEEWCKDKPHLEIEQQEIVVSQSKQFSLEDINKAIAFGFGIYRKEDRAPFNLEINEFIQSLSTQQLPKEFIPDYEEIEVDRFIPKMPINILKTITNSEGKEELIGIYKY